MYTNIDEALQAAETAIEQEAEQLKAKLAKLDERRALIAQARSVPSQEVAPVVAIETAKAKKGAKAAAKAAPEAAPAAPAKTKGSKKVKAEKTEKAAAAAPAKPVAAPAKAPSKKKASGKQAAAASAAAPEKPRDGDGKLPSLQERLRVVVGSDEVTIAEVIDRLSARGWLPDSGDMKAYISVALSTHTKDAFERVKRGVYRARPPGAPVPAKPSNGVNGAGPKTVKKASASNGASEEPNVLANPFATEAA